MDCRHLCNLLAVDFRWMCSRLGKEHRLGYGFVDVKIPWHGPSLECNSFERGRDLRDEFDAVDDVICAEG